MAQSFTDEGREVWDAYLKYHPRAIASSERVRLIERRVSEGYPVDLLVDAIAGNHLDPHCNGENDRMKQYHSIGLILRDADHIERYASLAEGERPADPVDVAWAVFERWMVEEGGVAEALDRIDGTYPEEITAEIRRRIEGEEV